MHISIFDLQQFHLTKRVIKIEFYYRIDRIIDYYKRYMHLDEKCHSIAISANTLSRYPKNINIYPELRARRVSKGLSHLGWAKKRVTRLLPLNAGQP